MRAADLGAGPLARCRRRDPILALSSSEACGIEQLAKKGNHARPVEVTAIAGEGQWEGWENQLKAIVIQWKVFGGLGVAID